MIEIVMPESRPWWRACDLLFCIIVGLAPAATGAALAGWRTVADALAVVAIACTVAMLAVGVVAVRRGRAAIARRGAEP